MIHKTSDILNSFFSKTLKLSSLAALAMGAHFTVAEAASSEWQDLGGGQARLVVNLNPTTNKVSGVVEVQLKKGWSTYWRYPGSSGIPPKFDFSKSQAFSFTEVKFPAPKLVSREGGAQPYAGYKSKVLFPFDAEMLSTADGKINLDLFIGLCEQICIPAKAEMEINAKDLFQSDPIAVQTVSFAKIHVPKERNAKDVILDIKLSENKELHIKTSHNKSHGTPSLFVEGPPEWYLTPASLIHEDEDYAVFKLDVSSAPKGTDILSQKLKYTLTTGASGIEIER